MCSWKEPWIAKPSVLTDKPSLILNCFMEEKRKSQEGTVSFKRTVFKSPLSKSPFRDTTLIQASQTSAGRAPRCWETLITSTWHVQTSNLCSKFLSPASLLSGSKPLVSRKKKKFTGQCITYSFFKNKTISFGNNNNKTFPIHRARCNSVSVLWLESGVRQWSSLPLLRNWLYLFRECEDVHCGLPGLKGNALNTT